MLGLRTVDSERKSYDGKFQWPGIGGTAIAPDWDGGKAKCGGGLHFLPWGEGDSALLNWSGIWQVVDDHDDSDTVLFDGKAKARELTVVFEGDRKGATDYILAHGGQGRAVVGTTVVAGDFGKAEAGDLGKVKAGDNGILVIFHWDADKQRVRVAYTGEDGILPSILYMLDGTGKFVLVDT